MPEGLITNWGFYVINEHAFAEWTLNDGPWPDHDHLPYMGEEEWEDMVWETRQRMKAEEDAKLAAYLAARTPEQVAADQHRQELVDDLRSEPFHQAVDDGMSWYDAIQEFDQEWLARVAAEKDAEDRQKLEQAALAAEAALAAKAALRGHPLLDNLEFEDWLQWNGDDRDDHDRQREFTRWLDVKKNLRPIYQGKGLKPGKAVAVANSSSVKIEGMGTDPVVLWDVRELLAKCGPVRDVFRPRDIVANKERPFIFVEMLTSDGAAKAVALLNQYRILYHSKEWRFSVAEKSNTDRKKGGSPAHAGGK
jgi:hypothetical protein